MYYANKTRGNLTKRHKNMIARSIAQELGRAKQPSGSGARTRTASPLRRLKNSDASSPAQTDLSRPRRERARSVAMRAARALAREFGPDLRGSPRFLRRAQKALDAVLSERKASADALGRALGMSRQTLHRRLRERGTSYKELLSKRRYTLAKRYLGQEHASVKVTAWRLGFSSPEAFSRAFKRWTGQSPAQFQATQANQKPKRLRPQLA